MTTRISVGTGKDDPTGDVQFRIHINDMFITLDADEWTTLYRAMNDVNNAALLYDGDEDES